ncbi:Hydroxyacid oxidase 1, partial [Orchesella cincta]
NDGSETTLVYRKNQTSSMRNFGVEVRGIRDVDNLLKDATIILQPKSVILKDLIEEIIQHVSSSVDGNEAFFQQVYQGLFEDPNAQMFANTLQGFVKTESRAADYDPSWLCAFCNLAKIKKRYIAIVKMRQPTNFGETCQEVRFFILVLCPSKSVRVKREFMKETKTALETARTFATIFSDPNLRNSLLMVHSEDLFKNGLSEWAAKLSAISNQADTSTDDLKDAEENDSTKNKKCCGGIGSGIKEDLLRRLPHYISDYTDGIADGRAVQKTISTSIFLYFACLLPTIAFATLNSHTTNGRMDVKKGIFAQTVGQMIFAVIGGQLSLFVKIIFSLSEFFDIVDQFEAFYCCVGLWCSFFLFLSAIFNMSKVMKYCTRSTEEIFALFISIAFVVYAAKDDNYNSDACKNSQNVSLILKDNTSTNLNHSVYQTEAIGCRRDTMQGFEYDGSKPLLKLAPIQNLDWKMILVAGVLGFNLAVLIFMDQNIGSAIVNNPANKLTKGPSYNWDLVVISIINVFSSLFTLPWLHVALPHAPLHVKCLADIEERVEHGQIKQTVVRVRETRLTTIISHILMGLSLLLLPYPLSYILPSVFDGLYLFMGITALGGNQLFERILLIFTEQTSYPPNHYIRRVPQRKIHQFTLIQVIEVQNGLVCVDDFEKEALRKLGNNAREFYTSGADDELTVKDNLDSYSRSDLDSTANAERCFETRFVDNYFGEKGFSTLGISPSAFQRLAHPDGECGSAKAVEKIGGIFVLSVFATSSYEEVAAAAPNARKWLQFYMHKDRSITQSIIRRAEKAGFEAMVFTVDAQYVGKRRVSFRNPIRFPSHLKLPNATPDAAKDDLDIFRLHDILDHGVTWEAVSWLKSVSKLPLVLKGIQTADDAMRAVELGVDAIIVSNHGGRQIDTVPTTIDILPSILRAVGTRAEVYVDGGIRRGGDIYKALAIGAKMVFVGRPAIWGLAVDGANGATKVLEILRDELDLTMALTGVPNIKSITPDCVCRRDNLSKL